MGEPNATTRAGTRIPPPSRVAIEAVQPELDHGRFPIKRIVGDLVTVEADVFVDGHDVVSCRLLHRRERDAEWTASTLTSLANDRWRGAFKVSEPGRHCYTVEGWVDYLSTWRRDMAVRIAAGQDVSVDILTGVALIGQAADRAPSDDAERLRAWARELRSAQTTELRSRLVKADDLAAIASRYPDSTIICRYERELTVVVDRERARFSTWYELFPRSCAPTPGRHGTLRDCAALVPEIAAMGFDVLYLPPIHPIGRTFRKGRNNSPTAAPDDVGSPWAIGAKEGGHTAIHPALGTLDDFRALVAEARAHGMEVALDLAYQCSPDHPYVTEHPEWFRHRPDGTIQYAENPPKKYQDIYPFDFECENWRALWEELRRIALFWTDQGVHIFRVDNPHTKTFAFWEWLIADMKSRYPDLIFLAEAFTRPRPMYRLAKLGFSQSYTYFTWRNTKPELTDYFEELVQTSVQEYFRPNLWPNTPDILHKYLQSGGRPAFLARAVLAATLGANYGIYGPAFELCEAEPREKGSEEYRNSEKYEIKHRDFGAPGSLRPVLTQLNRIRREHAALQSDRTLLFHETDNPRLICYSKTAEAGSNRIVTVVSLNPIFPESGWVTLDLNALGLAVDRPYEVRDLLDGACYVWRGPRNFVRLTPGRVPAHILRVHPIPTSSETTPSGNHPPAAEVDRR
jgi:starch synthase (maltosyl-transferring)